MISHTTNIRKTSAAHLSELHIPYYGSLTGLPVYLVKKSSDVGQGLSEESNGCSMHHTRCSDCERTKERLHIFRITVEIILHEAQGRRCAILVQLRKIAIGLRLGLDFLPLCAHKALRIPRAFLAGWRCPEFFF